MNVIQCFLPGAKHNEEGIPCSGCTFRYVENGVHIIALAEGPENENVNISAECADYLCRTIAVLLCKDFDRYYDSISETELKTIVSAVCSKALRKKAQEFQVDDIRPLSSALMAVAVKDTKAIVCHVGDGVIGSVCKNGLKSVSYPQNEAFGSSPVISSNPLSRERFDIKRFELTDEVSFFMMNKGISDSVFDSKTKSLREITLKMAGLINQANGAQILQKFVSDCIIDRNPNSDDCAFIVLSLSPEDAGIVPVAAAPEPEIGKNEDSSYKDTSFDFTEQDYNPDSDNSFSDDRDDITAAKVLKPVLVPVAVAVALILIIIIFIVFRPDLYRKKNNSSTTANSSSSASEITEEETEYIPAVIVEYPDGNSNDFNILDGIKKIDEIYKEHGTSRSQTGTTGQTSATEKPTEKPSTTKPTTTSTTASTTTTTTTTEQTHTQEPVTEAGGGEPVQNPAENE